jgi:hypothetical protein
MFADILTKPIQGPKFLSMCAFLMNYPVDCFEVPPFLLSPEPTLAPLHPS